MTEFIQHPVVQALAWALVHFVWQGAAIGLAAALAFRLVRSASARYAIGVGALVVMVVAPIATYAFLASDAGALQPRGVAPMIVLGPSDAASVGIDFAADSTGTSPALSLRIAPQALALAVLVWLTGVAFFSIRLFGGWVVARRYARRAIEPAAAEIQAVARQVADRLGLRRAVEILQSSAVSVPVMIGWLRPTIVFPIAALSGLHPDQVEALLAHELAHVRRHDYLVNLLQAAAEALLFYHPAVWWLSRRVRAERELCCDDLALAVCDRLVYASALGDLAAMATPGVALAATDGNLVSRVRRILGQSDEAPVVRAGVMPVLALALVAAVIMPTVLASAPTDQSALDPMLEALPLPQTPPAVTPAPQTTSQTEQQRMDEIRRKYEEVLKALAQLDQQRLAEVKAQIEAQQLKAKEQTQTARQAQVAAAEQALQDAKKRYATGLVSEQVLAEVAAALERAKAAGDSQKLATIDLKVSQDQLDRAKALLDKGLISEQQVKEMELALKKAQAQMSGDVQAQVAAALAEVHAKLARNQDLVAKGLMSPRDLDALTAQLATLDKNLVSGKLIQEQVAQALAAQQKSLTDARGLQNLLAERQARAGVEQKVLTEKHRIMTVAETEPVQNGDTLRVTISGEPDLPSLYTVGEDGTIRLPFVGAIKVAGLTGAQAREAIGKQLAGKKLGSANQVTVTVTRPIK